MIYYFTVQIVALIYLFTDLIYLFKGFAVDLGFAAVDFGTTKGPLRSH